VFWTVIQTSFEEEPRPKSNITEVKIKSNSPLEAIELVLSDEIVVTYDKQNMTKAEKEKALLEKAEKKYKDFVNGIQLIRRNILQNLTSEDPELCQCICKLNVTLEEAKQALDFMIQDLYERKEVNKQECYNPTNITWDQHPWECPKKPIDPVPIEDSETPSPPNTSSLLKTLK